MKLTFGLCPDLLTFMQTLKSKKGILIQSFLNVPIYLACPQLFRVEYDMKTALDREGQQINTRENQRLSLGVLVTEDR